MGGVDLGRSLVQPPDQSRVSPEVTPRAQGFAHLGWEPTSTEAGETSLGNLPHCQPVLTRKRLWPLVSSLNFPPLLADMDCCDISKLTSHAAYLQEPPQPDQPGSWSNSCLRDWER